MRSILLVLLATAGISSTAQAAKFRCFAEYQEAGRTADLFFYGDTQAPIDKAIRMEFIGANGFFLVHDLDTQILDFSSTQTLNFSSKGPDGDTTFKVTTTFNAPVGNYLGQLVAERAGRAMSSPARCVVLVGI